MKKTLEIPKQLVKPLQMEAINKETSFKKLVESGIVEYWTKKLNISVSPKKKRR